ncbi:(2Fe-2S) ferredoxin domain-containing protein [Terasakiella sp. A23]|uniref:(2Fe-2S) ferredoxin domain-containing protein n=1 Tax=Terasakiella sp. FCG-A23 TaxID=3080561 RepID=UPI002953C821|nr:(2Fe-2S) ferredoxin domain-containing protein [Terasakiella sp. A23]MDV7338612.1 (2Fe-2S) ferredoxin domain-containing protein [Terasakiella sp. A23]
MSDSPAPKTVYVCTNRRFGVDSPSCAMRGSEKTLDLLKQEVAKRGLTYPIEKFICLGQCTFGPAIRIAPGGEFFLEAKPAKIDEIMDWLEKEMEEA